jgi:hypothetical protein
VVAAASTISNADYFIYVVAMNYLTIFSGVLFLLAFILMGLVAQRIQRVFEVRTSWPLFFVGPVGALVYSVYTIVHGSGPTASGEALALERWLAYGIFLVGSMACWWGIRSFFNALRLIEAEGKKAREKRSGGVSNA